MKKILACIISIFTVVSMGVTNELSAYDNDFDPQAFEATIKVEAENFAITTDYLEKTTSGKKYKKAIDTFVENAETEKLLTLYAKISNFITAKQLKGKTRYIIYYLKAKIFLTLYEFDEQEILDIYNQTVEGKFLVSTEYKQGAENADISIYTYEDFECFFCKKLHDSKTLEKLRVDYPRLNTIHRNLPIIGGETSEMKAQVALCTGEVEGAKAYYSVHDLLYTRDQNTLSGILEVLEIMKFDSKAIRSCVESGKHKKTLEKAETERATFGITGTPASIIVNNKTGKYRIIPGAAPYELFIDTVEQVLKL